MTLAGAAGAVTVVVARLVKRGRERECEEWLAGIAEQMSAFEGFRSLELVRPVKGLQPEHVVILRFDSTFVAPHLPLPLLGRMLVTTVLNVAIMTYVVMPQLTWLLRSWLVGRPAESPAR